MFMKGTLANTRMAVCRLIAAALLFTSTTPAFEPPAPFLGGVPQNYPSYDITPSTGVPGREYTILVLSHEPTRKDVKDTTQLAPPGGITVSGVKATSNASLTARISIARDTPIGKYRFLLTNKDGENVSTIGTADFEVTAIGQGPIPPGIEPQVDVMWGVMPTDIVHHNFGRQIAKHYYGIQIRIGNDSGFDLQIAGIGFRLPERGIKNIIPSNSYRATRGTLEREQQIGLRATVMNVVRSIGSLYSGFLPFWHMPNRRANANLAGEIFSGPFQTSLEIVFPDTTVRQLTRLDDQTLRDGLIVKNNSQVVTLAWVPKEILHLSKDSGKDNNDDQRPQSIKNAIKNWKDDPQYVNLRLGELVLVGQQISYINRVQVISTSEGGPVSPPPTARGMNPQTLKRGEESSVVFSGAFLNNATITPPPGVDIRIPTEDIVVDKNGFSLRAKVQVGNSVRPGEYTLVLNSPGGNTDFKVGVEKSLPVDLKIEDGNGYPPSANPNAEPTISITITGRHLDGAKLNLGENAKNKLEIVAGKVNVKGDRKLTADIKVKKEATAGEYDLIVSNPDGDAPPLKFKVK